MSSEKPTQCSNSPNRTGQSSTARILPQTTLDGLLDQNYEESGHSFDHSKLQRIASNQQHGHSENSIGYLQHLQSTNLIQPFGCLLAIDAKSLKVIAFSENAPEMLTAVGHAASGVDDSPNLCIGINVVSLFAEPGATTLDKVLGFPDVSSLNPIIVQCKTSGKPFYTIVHHVAAGCLVLDFEPVNPSEFPTAVVWASQPYKLAAMAISKIQSLPGGSMDVLCNTLVEEVFDLMRYDRVMAYKFHEDYHGEVIAEITKPGLEPYIGLHYPATDIPQAARFLFMKNKVRIISDCHARPVKIVEDVELPLHVSLCGSTLRAPHSCHLQYMKNMKSVASLVIAVVVNEDAEDVEVVIKQQTQQNQKKKLWGLIICHHGSPRYVPFPLRHACEFIGQVFAVHISKELELEKQLQEKSIIHMQARLSNMLFREACPLSIISGSPNITDLVKCDGAALLYGDKVWQLHTTPTVPQIRDIAIWLSDVHRHSTSLSFDNLQDAAYPGLASLGDMICGMAMAKVTSSIILFWFRSHTTSEIKWGGAKHNPSDRDDCRLVHPRLSFKSFLDVVRMKSLPWNDYEMDAIDSLQLMVSGSLNDANELARVPILNNCIDHLMSNVVLPEVQAATREMFRLMETATVPIMAVDGNGLVSGWNLKVAQLTGLRADEVLGRHLLNLVEESSLPNVQRVLSLALRGIEEKEVILEVKTHGSKKGDGPVTMVVNACINRDLHEEVVEVCFVAQDMDSFKMFSEENIRNEGEVFINNLNLLTPMFGADKYGRCNEWNAAMAKLTGWPREEVLHKMLLGEVFDSSNASCLLKDKDKFLSISILINSTLAGDKIENQVPFGFFERNGWYIECLLSTKRKENADGVLTGVSCIIFFPCLEPQQAVHVQQGSEETTLQRSRYLDSGMGEFVLQDMVLAAVTKVQTACQGKGIIVSCDNLAEKFLKQRLFGDCIRLQKILSDFLFASVKFCPVGGSVAISSNQTKNSIGGNINLIDLELRIKEQVIAVPEEVLAQMFQVDNEDQPEEGLTLVACRNLLSLMMN